MVIPGEHFCVMVKEDPTHNRIIEFLVWVSEFATEHPPAEVHALWEEEQSLCEDRGGDVGMEMHPAEVLER
jgi:hypothetical protein